MATETVEQKRARAMAMREALIRKQQAGAIRQAGQAQPQTTLQQEIEAFEGTPPASRFAVDWMRDTPRAQEASRRGLMLGLKETAYGAGQIGFDVLESVGVFPEGTGDAVTRMMAWELAELENELEQEFGDQGFRIGLSRIGGQTAPFLVLPASRGGSLLSRTGQAAGGGALAGAVQFQPGGTAGERGEERLGASVVGASIGGAVAPLAHGLSQLRGFLSRRIARGFAERGAAERRLAAADPTDPRLTPSQSMAIREAQANRQASAFAEEGARIADETGVPLNLGQMTGDPSAMMALDVAKKSSRGLRLDRLVKNQQINAMYDYWSTTLSRLRTGSASFGDELRSAFRTTLGDSRTGAGILGARASQARADFNRVADLTGDDAFIALDNFTSTIDDLIASHTQRGSSRAQQAFARQLTRMRDDFGEQPAATAMELQNMLANWGDEASGSGRIFANIDNARSIGPAKRIFAALNDDLDTAVSGSSPAALALRTARDNYRINSLPIDRMNNSLLGRLFGRRDALDSVGNDDIVAAFKNARPDTIREAMDILEDAAPDLRLGLQRVYIEDKMAQALAEGKAFGPRTGPQAVARFSPGRMFELRKDPRFDAVFTDPETMRRVEAASAVTERVFVDAAERPASGGLPRLKEAFGVAASRDPTFAARLFGELFAPNVTLRTLTPEGVTRFAEMAAQQTRLPAAQIGAFMANLQAQVDEEMSK